MLNKKPTF